MVKWIACEVVYFDKKTFEENERLGIDQQVDERDGVCWINAEEIVKIFEAVDDDGNLDRNLCKIILRGETQDEAMLIKMAPWQLIEKLNGEVI